ncbi:MAG: lipoate--protein ligase [Bacteroidetes bacterium]|jgi:lipoate-protein ligase A|nr:lipoate--protein ligase [Bacteroidota bacterium]
MQILLSKSLNIFDHLATEEYLLKSYKTEFLVIWRSSPTVVVGKHQNLYAETHYPHIHRNKITLARRISGGGTVYHDEGNINFTFIKNGEEGKLVDFEKQTKPIIRFLNQLHVNASLGKRNNIFIDGLKISGNAEHIYKKRILHHGTLLFSANLQELENTLITHEDKFTDKAVKSVRARVTNINNYLAHPISIDAFIYKLAMSFMNEEVASDFFEPNNPDKQAIEELKNKKYITADWIFGYSPKYQFTGRFRIDDTQYTFRLTVEKGVIKMIESDHPDLYRVLKDQPHRFDPVRKGVKKLYPYLTKSKLNDVVYAFFY